MILKKSVSALCCAALLTGAAPVVPVVDPTSYVPQDKDERGLWMEMDEQEHKLQTSNFVMRDPALNDYVRNVFCKVVGPQCSAVRIYVMRTPYFNASMAPNGVMQIYSGLFLRARNEAQLAAVLGHEWTHYQNRHSLQLFRAAKQKSATAVWLTISVVGTLFAFGEIASFYRFSREMEAESDANSLTLMAQAGYDPKAASAIWSQLRDEMDATAAARGTKSRKDKDGGMFASHPPTADRMAVLAKLATEQPAAADARLAREEYRAALRPYWSSFIDDQIKLNDPGATEFLIKHLASEGWTSELNYAQGELDRARGRPEDLAEAVKAYRASVAMPDAPVEAWRGLGLALMRTGENEEAKSALAEYLKRKPEASDKAMLAAMAGITL